MIKDDWYGNKLFESIKGLTFKEIVTSHDCIEFTEASGRKFRMLHEQDCCESVTLEEVIGDVKDLLDTPILMAEVVESEENPADVKIPEYQDAFKWTFYKLATIKGSVTLRWHGNSNGYYYSVSVDFSEVKA